MLTLARSPIYIILIYSSFLLPLFALQLVANWLILDKAGDKGWKALIPFYGEYTLFKLVWDKNAYWFTLIFSILMYATMFYAGYPGATLHLPILIALLLVIYAVYTVFCVFLQIYLAKAFGCNNGFAVGLIFLHIIFYCILAFGNAKYIGAQPLRANKTDKTSH